MMDVALLGTGGMMPLPHRSLAALAVRLGGSVILIDCGEGTQVALKRLGWSFKHIDTILITHFHADHILGLPGLLLTAGNAYRTEPVTIVGPKGIVDVVRYLCCVAPVPFELRFIELPEEGTELSGEGVSVAALPLDHIIGCFGYSLKVSRAGKFDAEAAKRLGLPVKLWSKLQAGKSVRHEGKKYTPDMVMGGARKGLKLSYVTDTRPTQGIPGFVEGCDLFVCEGMYGQEDMAERAREHMHMTFKEAAELAKAGGVKELWLTHYSPGLADPEAHLESARRVFPNTIAGYDGMVKTLSFKEPE